MIRWCFKLSKDVNVVLICFFFFLPCFCSQSLMTVYFFHKSIRVKTKKFTSVCSFYTRSLKCKEIVSIFFFVSFTSFRVADVIFAFVLYFLLFLIFYLFCSFDRQTHFISLQSHFSSYFCVCFFLGLNQWICNETKRFKIEMKWLENEAEWMKERKKQQKY